MSDHVDTRDTRVDTREFGSMFDLILARLVILRADTHTRGAPTGLLKYPTLFRINPTSRDAFRSGLSRSFCGRVMIRQSWDPAVHGS